MAGRPPVITEEQKERFLEVLSVCGSVTDAVAASGLSATHAYRLMREEGSEFAARAREARDVGRHGLEDEARRRAYHGVVEPVLHQGRRVVDVYKDPATGEVVDERPVTVRRYSDTLLIFLLKGAFPEKYKERLVTEERDPSKVLPGDPATRLDLSKLDDEELRTMQRLIEKAASVTD